ncbi:MAG: CRTAC1 family protein, partial [Planctomycetota bacterium]
GNRLSPEDQVSGTWRLYRNEGSMRFTDVTAGSGLETDAWAGGAVAGDLDADGRPDLFVPCFGENRLYRNLGDGRFADVSAEAGVTGLEAEWSTGGTLGDVDGDGDLDLYVSNYADMRQFMVEAGVGRGCRWRKMPVPCGPQPMVPQRDRLYLNRGDGIFDDVTEAALPIASRYSFQAVFSDLDGDGALDLFVAADGHPNLLLLNDGTGKFVERARESGVATDADGREQACMGVAVGDVDDDGLMDLFVTNFSHEPNVLYRGRSAGRGRPVFADVTRGAGLDQPSFFTLGWGAVLADLDCDGDLDAVTANGHLYPDVSNVAESTAYEQHLSLLENLGGGRFREATAAAGDGVLTPRVHRGLLAADLDDDGRTDLFATVLNGRAVLLRNEGGHVGNAVRLVLRRSDGLTEAAGARAVVDAGGVRRIRDLQIGSSFGSSEDPRLLIGIGAEETADVAVRWPRRAGAESVTESFGRLRAGSTYLVIEGSGEAREIR